MLVESLIGNNDYQFYPTPPSIASKMLEGLDLRFVHTVLEPSAGKGDLLKILAEKFYLRRYDYGTNLDVDCCEIDPQLRQILKYEFSEEKQDTIDRMNNKEWDIINLTHMHIVHDNFLTYKPYKRYDLILMNPPFSEGDAHLLRAIDIQKNGGSIICLLNAETLRNPYTNIRKVLVEKLRELNADIEYINDAFSTDAERKANVDIAIVKIYIEEKIEESTIWKQMKKAVTEEIPDPEVHALVAGDYIEQAIQMFNTEVAATLELVKQYKALVPYMKVSLDPDAKYYDADPIIRLAVGRNSPDNNFDYNKYMRIVRLKYWNALFTNEKFTGKLTSELKKKYRENIDRMADYDFSAFNIKQIMAEMNASMMDGVRKSIMDLFDKLTQEHSYYPECSKTIHYFNGWKTNKAHKIGNKCIIPVWGMFSTYSWDKGKFNQSTAYEVINDIEKAFDYLNADREESGYDLNARLSWAHDYGRTRNIELKYFKIDLFKKGTMHIKFYPESMKLVERLNIYAARERKWLPPSYGQKTYSNMTQEEKTVIDSFHGNGVELSGEKEYMRIMNESAFYLSDPMQSLPALTA